MDTQDEEEALNPWIPITGVVVAGGVMLSCKTDRQLTELPLDGRKDEFTLLILPLCPPGYDVERWENNVWTDYTWWHRSPDANGSISGRGSQNDENEKDTMSVNIPQRQLSQAHAAVQFLLLQMNGFLTVRLRPEQPVVVPQDVFQGWRDLAEECQEILRQNLEQALEKKWTDIHGEEQP